MSLPICLSQLFLHSLLIYAYLSLCDDVAFFNRDPKGSEGMLSDSGVEEKWIEISKRWWWVACLFTGSLQIHSVPHMVWIIAAEPYKWIQYGRDSGAYLTKILVSFKWHGVWGIARKSGLCLMWKRLSGSLTGQVWCSVSCMFGCIVWEKVKTPVPSSGGGWQTHKAGCWVWLWFCQLKK